MNTGIFFILVCLWILQGCWVLCKKDYYKILGINKKATEKDIKKAFRKLAIRYHPDKNKSPDAEDKFKEIAESYEVLSNPEKRQQYDSEGEQFHFSGHATGHHFNFDDIVHMFDEDLMTGFGHKFGDFGGIHGSHHQYSAHANHKMNEFDIDDFFPRDFGQGDFFKFHTQDDLNMGDSFFGAHASAFSSWNNDGFSGTAETSTHRGGHGHHKSCKTVTRREGNMVSTHTTCS